MPVSFMVLATLLRSKLKQGKIVMQSDRESSGSNFVAKIGKIILGAPKQIKDPNIFHAMSLIPVLA